MFLFGIMFMSVVRVTGDDPAKSCKESPEAGKCKGKFVWNAALERCECHGNFPLFEFLEPTHQTSDGGRFLRSIQRHYFENCFTGQSKRNEKKVKILKMGVLVDRSIYEKVGRNEERAKRGVYEIVNAANQIFEEQFKIRIRVDKLFVASPGHRIPDARSWMDEIPDSLGNCTNDFYKRFGDFRTWGTEDQISRYALWHLFSACNSAPPEESVLGLAGGTVCYPKHNVGGSRFVGFPSTMYTFAHEVGHNLNAVHTSESPHNLPEQASSGIMGHASVKWEGIPQFYSGHRTRMCQAIDDTMTQDIWNINSYVSPKSKNAVYRRYIETLLQDNSLPDSTQLLRSSPSSCWADEDDEDETNLASCPCDPKRLGNGQCDKKCDVEACGFDRGDCRCAPECYAWLLGNNHCDWQCNTKECNYDANDCFGSNCKDDEGTICTKSTECNLSYNWFCPSSCGLCSCETNADCPTLQVPLCKEAKCKGCEKNDDCSRFAGDKIHGTPFCHTISGSCQLCTDVIDCTGHAKSSCENHKDGHGIMDLCPAFCGLCPCKTSADCPTLNNPQCKEARCKGCETNDDCSRFAGDKIRGTPFCHTISGTCRVCTDDRDCTGFAKSSCENLEVRHWMMDHCPAFCGLCHPAGAATSPTMTAKPRPTRGTWGSWTNWAMCSSSCGNGRQTRRRSCPHGQSCSGLNTESQYCKTQDCPVPTTTATRPKTTKPQPTGAKEKNCRTYDNNHMVCNKELGCKYSWWNPANQCVSDSGQRSVESDFDGRTDDVFLYVGIIGGIALAVALTVLGVLLFKKKTGAVRDDAVEVDDVDKPKLGLQPKTDISRE